MDSGSLPFTQEKQGKYIIREFSHLQDDSAFKWHRDEQNRKVDKFEKRHKLLGFAALTLFVAIPLPGTGAWSGSLVSWLLDLDRKKSIISIALGILIAGVIICLATLGLLNLLN